MSKFSFEFVTLSSDMEKTLKEAILPVRKAIGQSIAEAMAAPMNGVQAKRLGISKYLAAEHRSSHITADQRECSDATTERWINNVIEISRKNQVI